MKMILEETIVLTPSHSKTNVILPFNLEKDYKALEIRIEYSPKHIEDMDLAKREIEYAIEKFIPDFARPANMTWEDFLPLNNLATLSLDYEDKYIGCAHRHDPVQEHTISEGFSSPGFWNWKTEKGDYRAVINVHSISTDKVPYHITIMGVE